MQNWAGNITYSTDRLAAPTSVEQLQELVAAAPRVKVLGTGHTFNRIGDTDGELVTVRDLPPQLEIDETNRRATVPAGARYGEVAQALHARGFALHNLGSLPHISVAGACATGTHGSGNGNPCLAAAVRGVEFVRADGELVRIGEDDPELPGAALSLGALGVLTRVILAVEPTYDIAQEVWLDAPAATVLEHYDAITAAAYSVSLFSDPETPGRIDQIWLKRRAEPPVDGTRWGARPAAEEVHPLAGQDTRAATPQRGTRGPWHERLPHFRASFTPSTGDEQQSEFFVPRERAREAIEAVLATDLSQALLVAEFRTIAPDELWLSPFSRPTTALHFTWRDDDALVADALARLQPAITPFDPRPHWGKVFATEPADVQRHYPRLAEFRALAQRLDPGRKFGNPFLERFVY
ncbi:MAG TPA: FAD-binding protein [Jatrophihabitans sp.]|nr:FAD-binding protein [Jatrophihabitans sp.]